MREKRTKPAAIAEVIASGIRLPALPRRIREWRLLSRWESIVGEAVARHARPDRWKGRTLIVRVDGAAWMQELSFMRPQMLSRIAEAFPDLCIAAIRLEAGELPPLPPSSSAKAPRSEEAPLPDDARELIDRAVRRIGDDAVRDAARRAMTRGFQQRHRR